VGTKGFAKDSAEAFATKGIEFSRPANPISARRASAAIRAKVFRAGGSRMFSIDEELKAAKAAQAAIDALSKTAAKPGILALIRNANHIAIENLSSEGALNEARWKVGIALSDLTPGLRTRKKIDEAKRAVEDWIKQLRAA
jgi:hypothetical protein